MGGLGVDTTTISWRRRNSAVGPGAATERQIAGKQVVVASATEATQGTGQVIDLMEALRASLAKKPAAAKASVKTQPAPETNERKGREAGAATEPVALPTPAKARARK